MPTSRATCLTLAAIVLAGCSGAGRATDEPVFRRGRLERASRFVEAVGSNRIRVVAFDFGGVALGQCATPDGDLLARMCATYDGSPTDTRRGGPPEADRDPPFNAGMFRQYSVRTDTTGSTAVTAGPGAGSGKASLSRHVLVFEWRRYRLESLPVAASPTSLEPHVSALERGVAIRIVFNVTLRAANADASLSFGFGSIATALARNEATVEVGYELIGTEVDILPDRPTNITSVDGYIDAMNLFHEAVRRVALAWTCRVGMEARPAFDARLAIAPGGPAPAALPSCDNSPLGALTRDDAARFNPGVLAYYVSGVRSDNAGQTAAFSYGYLRGVDATADGDSHTRARAAIARVHANLSEADLAGMYAGLQQAILDLRGAGALESDVRPTRAQIDFANAIRVPRRPERGNGRP